MKKENNYKTLIIAVIVFVPLFGLILKSIIDSNTLNSSYRITIGRVRSIDIIRGSNRVDFWYSVDNYTYESTSYSAEYDKSIVGKRYYVKFLPSNPENSELLLNEPVPSNIKNEPSEGWEEIPK